MFRELSDEYSSLLAALAAAPPAATATSSGGPQESPGPVARATIEPIIVDPTRTMQFFVNRGGVFEVYRFRQPSAGHIGPIKTAESASEAWVLEEAPTATDGKIPSVAATSGGK
jgi:hypothetical protein